MDALRGLYSSTFSLEQFLKLVTPRHHVVSLSVACEGVWVACSRTWSLTPSRPITEAASMEELVWTMYQHWQSDGCSPVDVLFSVLPPRCSRAELLGSVSVSWLLTRRWARIFSAVGCELVQGVLSGTSVFTRLQDSLLQRTGRPINSLRLPLPSDAGARGAKRKAAACNAISWKKPCLGPTSGRSEVDVCRFKYSTFQSGKRKGAGNTNERPSKFAAKHASGVAKVAVSAVRSARAEGSLSAGSSSASQAMATNNASRSNLTNTESVAKPVGGAERVVSTFDVSSSGKNQTPRYASLARGDLSANRRPDARLPAVVIPFRSLEVINRRAFLYNRSLSNDFGGRVQLMLPGRARGETGAGPSGGELLLCKILRVSPTAVRNLTLKSPALLPLVHKLAHNLRTYFFGLTAIKHFPTIRAKSKGCRMRRKRTMRHWLAQYTPHRQVFLYLLKCVKECVPRELFGHSSNFNRFSKVLWEFVGGGLYDKMSVAQALRGFRLRGSVWLQLVTPGQERLAGYGGWLRWLLEIFCGGLVQSHFYATETAVQRYRLCYFRKPVWHTLSQKAMAGMEQKGLYKRLRYAEVAGVARESLGVCRLRFLPKAASLRPLTNLSASRAGKESVNSQLQHAFYALNLLKAKKPDVLGAGVAGLHDAATRWQHFMNNRHDRSPLYLVKADIRGCYDSMLHTKLLDVVKNAFALLDVSKFAVCNVAVVLFSPKSNYRKLDLKLAYDGEDPASLLQLLRQRLRGPRYRGCLVAVTGNEVMVSLETVMSTIRRLITRHVVKMGSLNYLQTCGIPQGSKVSSLLCDVYYGALEAQHWPLREGQLLIRLTDDFLLATPHKDRAEAFLQFVLKGSTEWNFTAHLQKLLINWQPAPGLAARVKSIDSSEALPWCGVLLDPTTGEASLDLSRYSSTQFEDSVSFDESRNAGQTLSRRLVSFAQKRCLLFLFSFELNVSETQVRNLYCLFVLTSLRLAVCLRRLAPKARDRNPAFICQTVQRVGRAVWRTSLRLAGGEEFVSKEACVGLCLDACSRVLHAHKALVPRVLDTVAAAACRHKLKHRCNDLSDEDRQQLAARFLPI